MSDFQAEQIREARANIAAHEEAERQQLAARVATANADVNRRHAARMAQEREADEARIVAQQARETAQQQAERDEAERQYTQAGGDPAGFDTWWQVEKARRVEQRIADQQFVARERYRKSF